MAASGSSRLYFDDVTIDRAAMLVTRGGRRVELEPKAFDVLLFLAQRPNELVTKAELIEGIWKGVAVTDHVLTRVIGQLRRALGDAAREARYIETVPTRGYRFIATVDVEPPSVDRPAVPPKPSEDATAVSGHAVLEPLVPGSRPFVTRRRVTGQVLWVVLAAAVAGVGGWLAASRDGATEAWTAVPPAARKLSFTQALDVYPDFSPDGRLLAYASSASGTFELEVRMLDQDGRPQRVTSDGHRNIQPDWSPDGQQLAYHSMASGGIWVVPALGGVPRRLAPVGASPAWSPDGRWLVFQSREPSTVEIGATPPPSQLMLLDVATGRQQPLTRPAHPLGGHTEPAWSPDGRRVAFIVRAISQTEIWSTPIAGGEPARVWSCRLGCSRVVYEPSARGIIFAVRGEGYFRLGIDPDTGAAVGTPELLVAQRGDSTGHIAVSPDGRSVAFTDLTTRSNLYALALDAAGNRAGEPVAITSQTGRTMSPAYSPDGTRIAFAARRETVQICLVSPDGGEVTPLPLVRDVLAAFRPAWTPGGGLLALAFTAEGSMVIAIDPRSRETQVVAPLAASDVAGNARFLGPAFMADGQHLVFARQDDRGVSVWTMDLRSRAERRLTGSGEDAVFPTPSPDGRWMAYEQVVDEGIHAAVMPAGGGPARRLTSGRGQTWPHSWSSDSRRLYVAMEREGFWSIASMSPETGEPRVLTTLRLPHGYLRYPTVSPSGDRVVYEQTETTGNIWQIPLWSPAARGTR